MAFLVLILLVLALRALIWAGLAWFVLLFTGDGVTFWPVFGIVAALDLIVSALIRGSR